MKVRVRMMVYEDAGDDDDNGEDMEEHNDNDKIKMAKQ